VKPVCACVLLSAGLAFAGPDDLKRLPDVAGKDVVVRVCTKCHGPGNIAKMRLTREDWDDQVADMVERGAKATPKELAAVVNYLTANFGPDAKVNVNDAPIDELKSVLGLSSPEANAIVEYRQGHGKFKVWRDLLKVPGVDAKKIEGKAPRMAF
jgi:competence ComEA-like helix-hairpin-helix protein